MEAGRPGVGLGLMRTWGVGSKMEGRNMHGQRRDERRATVDRSGLTRKRRMQSRGSHARHSGPGLSRSTRHVDRIEGAFDGRFEYGVWKTARKQDDSADAR